MYGFRVFFWVQVSIAGCSIALGQSEELSAATVVEVPDGSICVKAIQDPAEPNGSSRIQFFAPVTLPCPAVNTSYLLESRVVLAESQDPSYNGIMEWNNAAYHQGEDPTAGLAIWTYGFLDDQFIHRCQELIIEPQDPHYDVTNNKFCYGHLQSPTVLCEQTSTSISDFSPPEEEYRRLLVLYNYGGCVGNVTVEVAVAPGSPLDPIDTVKCTKNVEPYCAGSIHGELTSSSGMSSQRMSGVASAVLSLVFAAVNTLLNV